MYATANEQMQHRHMVAGMTCAGFSLIEVVIAIGIVSFAVLAIVALLPVGLNSARSAHEEAFAAQTLRSLSSALSGASRQASPPYRYTALSPFNSGDALLQWTVGGTPQDGQTIPIGQDGLPTTDRDSARLMAFIRIIPPSDLLSVGTASICLAWPGKAIITPVAWSGGLPQINKQQGSMETVLFLAPTPP